MPSAATTCISQAVTQRAPATAALASRLSWDETSIPPISHGLRSISYAFPFKSGAPYQGGIKRLGSPRRRGQNRILNLRATTPGAAGAM